MHAQQVGGDGMDSAHLVDYLDEIPRFMAQLRRENRGLQGFVDYLLIFFAFHPFIHDLMHLLLLSYSLAQANSLNHTHLFTL